jgi:hypothetical protein
MSLAIGSLLLVAVGGAYSASVNSVEQNDRFFRATQAARVSMNQILTQLRQCQAVTVAASELDMTTAAGASISYIWNSATNTLTITQQLSPPQTNTMANNVTACAFATDTQSVTMMMTVQVGNNSVMLSGAATPRRMVQYH